VTARRVALIGFGASGQGTADLIRDGAAGDMEVCAVLVRRPERYAEHREETGWLFTDSIDDLLATHPDIVVELAGHDALAAYGERILRSGATLLTISSGLMGNAGMQERLVASAREGGGRLVLPSGAIAGLDAIESAAILGIDAVRHVVRKHPRSLFSDPAAIAAAVADGAPTVLYEGPAREATQRFPQNVNVVAMVAMAGIGFDRTIVAVVSDPAVEHNTHEVSVDGPFGSIEIRVRNVPSPLNPKTGLIVAGSIVRALRRLDQPMLLGG
jgi:aspartate dehydrogenase